MWFLIFHSFFLSLSLFFSTSVHSNRSPDQSLHQQNHSLVHFSFLHPPPIPISLSLSLSRNQCSLSIKGHKTSAASVPLFNYQETHTDPRASHTHKRTHTRSVYWVQASQSFFTSSTTLCLWISCPAYISPQNEKTEMFVLVSLTFLALWHHFYDVLCIRSHYCKAKN